MPALFVKTKLIFASYYFLGCRLSDTGYWNWYLHKAKWVLAYLTTFYFWM